MSSSEKKIKMNKSVFIDDNPLDGYQTESQLWPGAFDASHHSLFFPSIQDENNTS